MLPVNETETVVGRHRAFDIKLWQDKLTLDLKMTSNPLCETSFFWSPDNEK